MHRCQVPEENHQYCDQWDLAVCWPVGIVSFARMGKLWAGTFRTCLLNRLDRLRGVPKPCHLYHVPVGTLHIPPLSDHCLHLFWNCLETAQGLPIHPEQWFSIWQHREENHSCKYETINAALSLFLFSFTDCNIPISGGVICVMQRGIKSS